MKARGNKGLKLEDIMKVLEEWPNFNIATIMTVAMSALEKYHNTTAWYGYNPPTHEPEVLLTAEE